MKLASATARYLLGFLFTFTGSTGLTQRFLQPLPTNPLAVEFLKAAVDSHFAAFFFGVQLIAGLLLLSGFFVPLALILLAAELYNILAFHLTLAPGAPPALLACALWILVFLRYRDSFEDIMQVRPLLRNDRPLGYKRD